MNINDFLEQNGFVLEKDMEYEPYYSFKEHWYVAKWRVLFGYRLRAGIVGSATTTLDICCGPLDKYYDKLLKQVTAIMIHNYNNHENPFKGIPPHSEIKPYYNDDDFLNHISSLYNSIKHDGK